MNARTLAAAAAGRVSSAVRKVRLLRDLCKLFILEARDRPADRDYLMACAQHIFQRVKRAEGRL